MAEPSRPVSAVDSESAMDADANVSRVNNEMGIKAQDIADGPLRLNDALLLAHDLGGEVNVANFLDGFERLIRGCEKFPAPDQHIVWRKLSLSLQQSGGAQRLLGFLEKIDAALDRADNSVRLPNGRSLYDKLLQDCLPKLGSTEFSDLASRIEALPEGSYKLRWSAITTGQELASDPAAGIKALPAIKDPVLRAMVEPVVLTNLAYRQPEAAAAYFLSEQCNAIATHALAHAVFSDWLLSAPGAASEAIRNAAPSTRRDFAILVMVRKLAASDREAAAIWLPEIVSPEVRGKAREWMVKSSPRLPE